jgi:sulfite exporter TauE/SafE
MLEPYGLLGFFLLGLAGGFGHCVGMCGPFVLYIARATTPEESARRHRAMAQAQYNAGRLVTYVLLGAIAGALGGAVDLVASLVELQRVAAVSSGFLLVVYAIASLRGRSLEAVPGVGWLVSRLTRVVGQRAMHSPLLIGLVLGLLPCGLVYAAVIAAAATSDPVTGALGLGLFGFGTVPALFGVALSDELLARHRALLNRVVTLMLLVAGGYFIYTGLFWR